MPGRRDFLKIGSLALLAGGSMTSALAALKLSGQKVGDAKLKSLLESIRPFGPEDFQIRWQKASRLITEHKLGSLWVEPGPTMQYFTGVNWWRSERTFGFLLFPDRAPVWVCSAFELDRAREMIPADQEIRTWEENESPFLLIGKTAREYSRTKKIGIEPSTRVFIVHGLRRDAPGLELMDGSPVSDGCRGIKSEKEIKCLEAANRITKLAYREAFGKLKEGMTQDELAGFIREAHAGYGVSGSGGPSFGPASSFPHGSRKRKNLEKGDAILVDGGCRVEGYSSDVTRTLIFGRASALQEKIWDTVRRAQLAALNACRPGAACEDVDRAARKVVEEAGFGPGYKYFSHRVGHGIGLEGHEYPYLVQGNKLRIQPGMTFSNEPGIYLPGEFGIRIEDCMVVTEEGARIMGGLEAVSLNEPFAAE
ncbi:MAG: Aminopeptidase YpdF (MP-, MA-, MS-, AP-, NP- specific) [Candidatus Saccharicenans subterraneus]|uniref:Aminopeptidase YpdF (MP-, MA-, MS-, AP-, NP-specific) n=1 Tax=Candidatus Saccharicenans subterraneus TaxID=2508984 RepID=A0A3E2BMW3_9BACT|nr:MAG: Aminopeptidase YpdF (MP-, MA-, MS-, AP-, NP- specific) [Candidatus Saccharicenans subterraneum]